VLIAMGRLFLIKLARFSIKYMIARPDFESSGYTLVELLVVLALLASVFIPIYSLYQSTLSVEFTAIDQSQAGAYAQDALEAIYAIYKDDWSVIADGSYYLALNQGGQYWELEKVVDDQAPSVDVLPLRKGFFRQILIRSVWRDAEGRIYLEDADDRLPDNLTKLVTVTVSWGANKSKQVVLNTYISEI